MYKYKEDGELFWEGSLDSYGRLNLKKGENESCPFRYQGQYEDVETGLYYNRFRYYSPEEGGYISQDPIGLNGGLGFYNYVRDPNLQLDEGGLKSNSAILGGNLGPAPAENHDAHHIVMSGSRDPKMESLRNQMNNFKPPIDINSKENGIWLPRTESDKVTGGAQTAHKGDGVHGDDYKQKVFDKLDGKNRDEFLKGLKELNNDLKKGTTYAKK